MLGILLSLTTSIVSQDHYYSYEQDAMTARHEINALKVQVTELLETLRFKLEILNDLYVTNCSCPPHWAPTFD